MGEKNEEGESVTDFAMAFDLSIVNTFFEKRPNHLVTFKSGGRESQIDFLMCRRQQLNEVKELQGCQRGKCGGAGRSAGAGLGDQVQ